MKFTSQIYSKGRTGGGAWITCGAKKIFSLGFCGMRLLMAGEVTRGELREKGGRGGREKRGDCHFISYATKRKLTIRQKRTRKMQCHLSINNACLAW